MNFTWVSWGFTELACLANLSQVGQCVSSAFLAHTMSLSDVCDSFSLYLWLYVCPKVDPLADQMLYMYGSTHFPVTLSPSRLLTTKRLTCAESSHKRWGLVKGIPRQPSPCLFCEVADPYPASSVAYRSLNKRKKEKMQHSHLYLISWKYHPYPRHSSMLVLLCRCMALRFQKVLYSATKIS